MLQYADEQKLDWKSATVAEVKEIAGHGLTGQVNGKPVMVGNTKLLKKFNINYPPALDAEVDTIAIVTVGGQYCQNNQLLQPLYQSTSTVV